VIIQIIAFGSPAPQGSKKFVGTTETGRGILVESSKAVRPWRMDVKAAAAELLASQPGVLTAPLDGPLRVAMVFTLRKPAGEPKTKRSWPCRKPDLSKLVRSTEDALTDAGIWADDARVVEYSRLAKVFPGEDPDALPRPGVRIRIEAMTDQRREQVGALFPSVAEEAEREVDRIFG
jgi:crossover junction endodeoxyribonuclease RusA